MRKIDLLLFIIGCIVLQSICTASSDWVRLSSSDYKTNIQGLSVEINATHLKLIEDDQEKSIPLSYFDCNEYLKGRTTLSDIELEVNKNGEIEYCFTSRKHNFHLGTFDIYPEYDEPLALGAGIAGNTSDSSKKKRKIKGYRIQIKKKGDDITIKCSCTIV